MPDPSDVAAARLLVKLMKRRGAVPPEWAMDLAEGKGAPRKEASPEAAPLAPEDRQPEDPPSAGKRETEPDLDPKDDFEDFGIGGLIRLTDGARGLVSSSRLAKSWTPLTPERYLPTLGRDEMALIHEALTHFDSSATSLQIAAHRASTSEHWDVDIDTPDDAGSRLSSLP